MMQMQVCGVDLYVHAKLLICGHPSIMAAEIFGPNGGQYRGVPLYRNGE